MSIKTSLTLFTAVLALGAGSATAGGVIAPVVEVAPIEVAPVSVAGAWQGAYAGGSLGYIFGADDVVGLVPLSGGEPIEGRRAFNLGDLDVSGATAGVHVGYRWQRDRWVFGPELGVEVGSVDADVSSTYEGTDFSLDAEMQNIVTLVMKTGYSVDPQTLVYGTFGVARGNFDYTASTLAGSQTDSITATGVAAGLGVERAMNDRMSVFAEYQYRDLGNEQISFEDGADTLETATSTAHSSIKLGANFKF
ncbi:porin family protein [Paracoccus gahaiensis]|uniref:Porin family protein n=1 Tax=Paracoccus gahaiensis TaxID=1706839 RepID=A0A4U0RD29_9RHOB|nr:outer membrane beta-barrel protein [Paracoccus gahaiensis]TJZ93239.1 porin family protein [Paracoccus gahaiensis]